MAAGTTVLTADIPILNDEISEAEDFVVVLEVVSNVANQVKLTTNATCVGFFKMIISAT